MSGTRGNQLSSGTSYLSVRYKNDFYKTYGSLLPPICENWDFRCRIKQLFHLTFLFYSVLFEEEERHVMENFDVQDILKSEKSGFKDRKINIE